VNANPVPFAEIILKIATDVNIGFLRSFFDTLDRDSLRSLAPHFLKLSLNSDSTSVDKLLAEALLAAETSKEIVAKVSCRMLLDEIE
jgi:hypothetical protein